MLQWSGLGDIDFSASSTLRAFTSTFEILFHYIIYSMSYMYSTTSRSSDLHLWTGQSKIHEILPLFTTNPSSVDMAAHNLDQSYLACSP